MAKQRKMGIEISDNYLMYHKIDISLVNKKKLAFH